MTDFSKLAGIARGRGQNLRQTMPFHTATSNLVPIPNAVGANPIPMVTYIELFPGDVIANMAIFSGNAAAVLNGAAGDHLQMGLIDRREAPVAHALLCSSADKASAWALGAGEWELFTMQAAFEVATWGFYGVTLGLSVGAGGTNPTLRGSNPPADFVRGRLATAAGAPGPPVLEPAATLHNANVAALPAPLVPNDGSGANQWLFYAIVGEW